MSWANAWFFLLFVPLLLVAWRLLRRARRTGIRFSAVGRIPARAATWRSWVAALAPWLLLVSLALLVLAAARPRLQLHQERRLADALAIVMTVDISGSMDALDLTPKGERYSPETTRLAVVKRLFAEFVEKRPEDLIGLVTFGGYASTRVPLTIDHAALLHVLKGVQIPTPVFNEAGALLSQDEVRTAIGDGLATALARLRETPVKSKVVILLSDGENNTGAVEPDEAAALAAKMGVKVYAIGVGTRARRVPFLARHPFTGEAMVQMQPMQFDEQQLKAIASRTGGRYFAVNDRDSLAEALAEIDAMERTQIEGEIRARWRECFSPFLVAGALLAFVAVSLSMVASRRVA